MVPLHLTLSLEKGIAFLLILKPSSDPVLHQSYKFGFLAVEICFDIPVYG